MILDCSERTSINSIKTTKPWRRSVPLYNQSIKSSLSLKWHTTVEHMTISIRKFVKLFSNKSNGNFPLLFANNFVIYLFQQWFEGFKWFRRTVIEDWSRTVSMNLQHWIWIDTLMYVFFSEIGVPSVTKTIPVHISPKCAKPCTGLSVPCMDRYFFEPENHLVKN